MRNTVCVRRGLRKTSHAASVLLRGVLAAVLLLTAAPMSSFAEEAGPSQSEGSTRHAPTGYAPQTTDQTKDPVGSDTDRGIAAVGEKALLIQDVDPWASNSNVGALQELGIPHDVISSYDVATTDLGQYKFVLYASDQPTWYYDNLDASIDRISSYVSAGGVLVAHSCDQGWNSGSWVGRQILPAGVSHVNVYSQNLTVASPSHPILSGYSASSDYFANWNYSTHGYFTNLPAGAASLIGESGDPVERPVYIHYTYGSGQVLATMQTIEWGYAGNYSFRPEFLLNELRYAWSGGQASRAWLIKSIKAYRESVLRAFDSDIKLTATEYALGSELRTSFWVKLAEWLSGIWRALRSVVGLIGKFAGSLFFKPNGLSQDTAGLSKNVRGFSSLMSQMQETAEYKFMSTVVFVNGLFGDFKDLTHYHWFSSDLGGFSTVSDGIYKEVGKDHNLAANSMRWELMGSPGLAVPLRAGAVKGGAARPDVTEWSRTPGEARTKVRKELDDLLASIPNPLPPGYPTAAVAMRFDQLSTELLPLSTKAVNYPSVVGQSVVERRVSRGVINDYWDVNPLLFDALDAHWDVRTWEVVKDGLDLELTAVTFYAAGGQYGTVVSQVKDGYEIATGLAELGENRILPETYMSPIDGLTSNAVKMTSKIPGQTGNLWAITRGLCDYARLGLGGNAAEGSRAAAVVPSAALSGVVYSDGGYSLSGIAVALYRQDPGFGWQVVAKETTDYTGYYAFNSLQAGSYRVYAADPSEGHMPSWYADSPTLIDAQTIELDEGEAAYDIDLTLTPAAPGTLTGSVCTTGGAPVDGAVVDGYREEPYGWAPAFSAITDSYGEYYAYDCAPGSYRVRVSDPQGVYGAERPAATVDVQPWSTGVVGTVALDFAASVSGSVVESSTMTPLAGMTVSVYSQDLDDPSLWSEVATATTDASGSFSAGGLGAGDVRIGVSSPEGDHATRYYPDAATVADATTVVVQAGADEGLAPIKLERLGSITGSVECESSPVEYVAVDVYRYDDVEGWQCVATAVSGELGHFEVAGLAPGTYRVGFRDPADVFDGLFFPSADDVVSAQDVEVPAGETAAIGVVELSERATGALSGQVTGSEGALGDIWVEVYAPMDDAGETEWRVVTGTSTAEDGSYRLDGLDPGEYRVGFSDTEGVYGTRFYTAADDVEGALTVGVSSGAETDDVSVAMVKSDSLPPTTRVFGTDGGWRNEPAYVSFTAEDDESEIATISYQIDDGVPQTYAGRIEIWTEGVTSISYWAEDEAGNVESPKLAEVWIDYTPPVTLSDCATLYTGGGATVALGASDSLSGVSEIRYSVDGDPEQSGNLVELGVGTHLLTYYSIDVAGNYEWPQQVWVTVTADQVLNGTMSLENGASWCDRTFTMDSSVPGAVEFRIRSRLGNESMSSWSSWQPYVEQYDQLVPHDGTWTFEAHYRDGDANNLYLSDSIVVDTTPPSVGHDCDDSYKGEAEIRIQATDASGSGVASVSYKLDGGAWQTVSGSIATVRTGVVGDHVLLFLACDRAGNDGETGSATFSVTAASASVVSVAGATRYDTAIEASKRAYPDGASTVVIATGANWPDALGGAALAGQVDGPLLLTTPGALPSAVLSEIGRLKATDAYILGGIGAVSAAVQAELETRLSGDVTRLAGADRYGTANKVADEVIGLAEQDVGGFSGKAYVATGANFPDALGASPLAASAGTPILLAAPDAMPYLPDAVDAAVLLGGTGAVTAKTENGVETALGAGAVTRVGGADRYETAAKVADFGVTSGMHWDGVGVATGAAFPDALSGGAMLGSFDSVLLLTRPDSLVPVAEQRLAANKDVITTVHFIGGTGAVSQGVRDRVAQVLQ